MYFFWQGESSGDGSFSGLIYQAPLSKTEKLKYVPIHKHDRICYEILVKPDKVYAGNEFL
jgi:hypothetical protein